MNNFHPDVTVQCNCSLFIVNCSLFWPDVDLGLCVARHLLRDDEGEGVACGSYHLRRGRCDGKLLVSGSAGCKGDAHYDCHDQELDFCDSLHNFGIL